MSKLIGREVGAANHLAEVDDLFWFDLTAGDGVVQTDAIWERNCSPGILAHHARASRKPVGIHLFERSGETFIRLDESLHEQLPRLGYRQMDEGAWWHKPRIDHPGDVVIIVWNDDGCDAIATGITNRTAVVACHDPNTVNQRAMRPTFMSEIRARTPWCQAISTMGCNPAGLKRLPMEERRPWFDFVAEQRENLPGHHDLTFAAIERDDAQWAYLLCHAAKWRDRVIAECNQSFGLHGMSIDVVSLEPEPERFAEMQRRLFLTKRERQT